MARAPLPPVAAAIGFIDGINRGDLDRLGSLMCDDHRLVFPDEPPVVGRAANLEAWRGYFSAFPDYVVHPRHLAVSGSSVGVVGATTGSHLGLADDEELAIDVIWIAEVVDGALSVWEVADDTPSNRARAGLAVTS